MTDDNRVTYKWIVGILVSVFMIITGAWVASVNNAVQRVPVLEEKLSNYNEKLDKLDSKIDAISTKLNVPVIQ